MHSDSDLSAAVAGLLCTRRLGRRLEFRDTVGSTNDLARTLGRQGAPDGLAVLADAQSAGRGRQGRPWQSPPGTGVWLSVLLRPPLPPAALAPLTLVVAVAVATALRELDVPAGIKWPNDIYVGDRKCCGILTELDLAGDRVDFAVVGMGLNVNQDAFPPELAATATSLRLALGRPVDRAPLVAALLAHLEGLYDQFLAGGLPAILDRWRALSITLGRTVTVRPTGGDPLTGVAEDVGADGALLLRLPDGRRERLLAGEVLSLRPVQPG